VRDLHELPFRITFQIVLAFFVVMSGGPGKSWIEEEEQAYKWLTHHHMCEPTLAFLLCRNDLALAEAMTAGKVFQRESDCSSWHGVASL